MTLATKAGWHANQIADAQAQVQQAKEVLEARVIAARRDGMTWTLIAQSMGKARQSVTERFTRVCEVQDA